MPPTIPPPPPPFSHIRKISDLSIEKKHTAHSAKWNSNVNQTNNNGQVTSGSVSSPENSNDNRKLKLSQRIS